MQLELNAKVFVAARNDAGYMKKSAEVVKCKAEFMTTNNVQAKAK